MRPARLYQWVLCAAKHWSANNASATGASLAFFCAFSIAPLLVILLAIAGAIVGAEAAYGQVGAQLTGLFGASTAKVVMGAVRSAQHTDGVVSTIVSIITLIVGATTVLAALQQALDIIWKSKKLAKSGWRGWMRTRLLSFGFILTLGFLLLISLTISTGLANVRQHFATRHAALVGVIGAVDVLTSFVIVSALFALIYRYMPSRRLAWRQVLAGGALTAVLFDIGRRAIGLYLAHSTQPSAFGAAASFAVLLLWLYYTAQIFLFGAEFTACLAGIGNESAPAAEAVR